MNKSKTHVINPLTGRLIKIGSRIYISLCKNEIITPDDLYEQDENVVYKINDTKKLTEDEKDIKLETARDFLDTKKYNIVKKGKGVYKDSLVKRKKALSHDQVKAFTMDIMKNPKIQELYDSDIEYDSEEVEKIIMKVLEG